MKTLLILFPLLALLITLSLIDSHHFNLRYKIWQWVGFPIAGDMRFRYLPVDSEWKESLISKDLSHALNRYPEAIPAEEGHQSYQSMHELKERQARDFSSLKEPKWYWLSPTSNWALLADGRRVVLIDVFK